MGSCQDSAPPSGRRPPALWPFLMACAGAAVLADFGNLHREHLLDSLTPVLVSLQRWTPFFWCQDRMGMLVPALALPLRDPLANLLFQEAVYVFAGLAAMFLFARYLVRDDRYPLVGGVMAALFVGLAAPAYRFDLFNTTFYGVWLALVLAALVAAEPRPDGPTPLGRALLALALVLAAHWAYIATAVVFGPLVVLRSLFNADVRKFTGGARAVLRRALYSEGARSLVLLGVGWTGGLLLTRVSPHHINYSKVLPVWAWSATYWRVLRRTWADMTPHHWVYCLAALAAAGLALLSWRAVRRRAGPPLRTAAALVVTAGGFSLLMASREWVLLNCYAARYFLPAVFLLQGAVVLVAVAPLAATLRPAVRRGLGLLTVPALLGATLLGYGPPSLSGVRADLKEAVLILRGEEESASLNELRADPKRRIGYCTEDIVAARCTHLAGNCFLVWPRVYHVNLALAERGEARPFWGISFRADETWEQWKHLPPERLRVAVAAGDTEAAEWLRRFRVPRLTVVEKRRTIWVLAVPPPADREAPVAESKPHGDDRTGEAEAPAEP